MLAARDVAHGAGPRAGAGGASPPYILLYYYHYREYCGQVTDAIDRSIKVRATALADGCALGLSVHHSVADGRRYVPAPYINITVDN